MKLMNLVIPSRRLEELQTTPTIPFKQGNEVEYFWELPDDIVTRILDYTWVEVKQYTDCTGKMKSWKKRNLLFPNVQIDPRVLTVRMILLKFRNIDFIKPPPGKMLSYILARNRDISSLQFQLNTEQLKIINNRRISSKRKLPTVKNLSIKEFDIQEESLYHWNYFINESKFGKAFSKLESLSLKDCTILGYQLEYFIRIIAEKKIPLKKFFVNRVQSSVTDNFKKLKHFPLENLTMNVTHTDSDSLMTFLLQFRKTLKRLTLIIDGEENIDIDQSNFPELIHFEIIRN